MKFCSLYSGSGGNSIYVSSERASILIDAGMPGKSIESAFSMIKEDLTKVKGIFVTHEHTDHTKGVGILSRKFNIPIYANLETWKAMQKTIGKIKEENIKVMGTKHAVIEDLDITAFDIPHDAVNASGYSVHCRDKKISIATDLGHFNENIRRQIMDSNIILLECNHDVEMVKFGPYPYPLKQRILSDVGHLSNDNCGKAILSMLDDKPKRIVLGHLSQTNNYPELAKATVKNILDENNVKIGKDVLLYMADRAKPSSYIEL